MINATKLASFNSDEVLLIARLAAKVRADIRRKDTTLRSLRTIDGAQAVHNPYFNSRMRITPAIWNVVAPCISLRVERTCAELSALERSAEKILCPFRYGDRVEYKDTIHTITHIHPGGECTLDHTIRVNARDLKSAPLPSPAADVSGMDAVVITDLMVAEMAANEGAHLRIYTRGYLVAGINATIKAFEPQEQPLTEKDVTTHLDNARYYGILPDCDYFKALPIVQMTYPQRYLKILIALRNAIQMGKSILAALREATITQDF